MSEHNTIYDLKGTIVGHFRFGVAWSKDPRLRLGEYDDAGGSGFVYDNDGNMIAKFADGTVLDQIGEPIGTFEGQKLIINGAIVGTCIGSSGASAAAIALIFNQKSESE